MLFIGTRTRVYAFTCMCTGRNRYHVVEDFGAQLKVQLPQLIVVVCALALRTRSSRIMHQVHTCMQGCPHTLSYTAQIIHATTSMHSSEASAIATSNLRPPTTMLITDRPDRDRQMSTSFSSFAGISIKLLRQER